MKKNIYRMGVFLPFMIFLSSLSHPARAQNVAINTDGALGHPSAMLDVNADDMGILIPRVALTGVSSPSPIVSPEPGLLVYNTNPAITDGYGKGFYFWNDSLWAKLATGLGMSNTMTSGRIMIADSSGMPVEHELGGDATLNHSGMLDLKDMAVETSEIDDTAITTPKLADNSVTGRKINIDLNAIGDLLYYDGTDWTRLPAGNNGEILSANGAGAPSWIAPAVSSDFENGLVQISPGTVGLGGTLTRNTSINQNNYRLAFNTNISNGFSVSGNALSVNGYNGNVGIGTPTPQSKLEVNGDILLRNYTGRKSIYTWNPDDDNWRIGMNNDPGFTRSVATGHVQYVTYNSGATQGFAVGINGGSSGFEIAGTNHTAFFRGNVGIRATAPAVPLAVGGDGVDVDNTSIWAANNIHVQGSFYINQGGRGRLRVGNQWGYMGLYTETSSTGNENDLLLGAGSGLVRVGAPGQEHQLRVTGLEGTGTRIVSADPNGQLGSGMQMVYGSINANGYIVNHGTTCTTCGYSISKVATGIYRITFSTPFSGTPTVIVTEHFPNNGNNWFNNTGTGGSTLDNALTVAVTSTYADIKTGNASGNPLDRSFNFIALGPR